MGQSTQSFSTARGAICDRDAVAQAGCEEWPAQRILWDVQPVPSDHPWRTVKKPLGSGNAMVPHSSGTTLDTQTRYSNGVKQIIDDYLYGKPRNPANVIVGNETKACEGTLVFSDFAQTLAFRHSWLALNKRNNRNQEQYE